jgi:hypothetical protein
MKKIQAAVQSVAAFYSPRFPSVLTYMLQSTEYQAWPYITWFWRTQNFATVMNRRSLARTKAARLLTLALQVGMLLEIIAGGVLIYLWHWHNLSGGLEFGLALIVAYPVVWAHVVLVPLVVGREVVVKPNEKRRIAESEAIFNTHPGINIAIAGKKVAATPANMNVPISHARFAASLTAKEDILLIEYGEGAPGDVERFSRTTHPTHGVITGLAPAHLDHYKTLKAAGQDIFSLATYLKDKNTYVNSESPATKDFVRPAFHSYNREGVLGWNIRDVHIALDGTRFSLHKGKKHFKLHSALLGRHQLGPLSLAVALADTFGLSEAEITKGIAETKPFEHRMQPYLLAGAWVIDDTYNGNIEGIRAGTELLKELPATRKIYVTPGLVDQGQETERVHQEMGELIARAEPDLVVLMQNSATKSIQAGLAAKGFDGELQIEQHPLEFYTNLPEFLAAGDLVLMQNDWTDNYA